MTTRTYTETEKEEYFRQVQEQCRHSNKAFAKIFFPNRFRLPFATRPLPELGKSIHDAITEALDDKSLTRVVIRASRKIGKTSFVQLSAPAKAILFREYHYIVPISTTAAHAEAQSEALKKQLKTNPLIREMYPKMIAKDRVDLWTVIWKDEEENEEFMTIVQPRGYTQQIRGLLYDDWRPDYFLVDDIDDAKDSEDVKKKKHTWFFSDLLSGLSDSEEEEDARVFVIGNPSSYDSIIEQLSGDSDWETIVLPICDQDYKSYWEVQHSSEGLTKKAGAYKRQGQFGVFAREFMGSLVSGDEGLKEEYFAKYIEESEADLRRDMNLVSLVITDPSRSADIKSAPTGIIGVSVDMTKGRILIRDAIKERLEPDEIQEQAFQMADDIKAMFVCVEDTGLKEHIQHPWLNAGLQQNKPYTFIWVKPRGKSKVYRVGWFQPYLRRGEVFFRKEIADLFLQEGVKFPNDLNDMALLDCLAYIAQVMEENMQYFNPDNYHIKGEISDQELRTKAKEENEDLLELSLQEHLAHEKEFNSYGVI